MESDAADVIDRVMAVVGGRVITLSDTRAVAGLGLALPAPAADPTAAAVDWLVERALVLVEVERYAPADPQPEAVAARQAEIAARVADQDALARLLVETGYGEPRLRELARDQLRIDAYMEQRFAGAPPDRRTALVADWIESLKRRAEITILYLPGR